MNKPHTPEYRAITSANIRSSSVWERLDDEMREVVEVVSTVLPFRTNAHVVDELIDWDRVPDDPIFQLTFPQRGMLAADDYDTIARALRSRLADSELEGLAVGIRMRLNPHPDGQTTHNHPRLGGQTLRGLQHKYRRTVLYFPSLGQTCHAYCTFCFRWAQFVDSGRERIAGSDVDDLIRYLRQAKDVTDLLITGGDPLTMRVKVLEREIEALLAADLGHVHTLRIGTKAPFFWPHRFLTDRDADELLSLFERVGRANRRLAIMLHASHPRELDNPHSREALRRIRSTGATLFLQSPAVRHVNDDPAVWADLWTKAVGLGIVPYYMFVERNTGAHAYFAMPLMKVWRIYTDSMREVSGLAQTARGPVMSTLAGKVRVIGPTEVAGRNALALEYVQARDESLKNRPFYAHENPYATWFDQLEPLTAADEPYFSTDPRLAQVVLQPHKAQALEELREGASLDGASST